MSGAGAMTAGAMIEEPPVILAGTAHFAAAALLVILELLTSRMR